MGHVRDRTLLVEQRLIGGEVVPGQKVRHFRPRAVDLIGPLKQDLAEYRLAMGRPLSGLLFPRRDGAPWRITDVNNWCRRVWHPACEHARVDVLPPYHLRHAFASLRSAGTSIPELAEQMGHSPQMTLSTYAHVMRELKGQPALSAGSQVDEARARRRPQAALFAEHEL